MKRFVIAGNHQQAKLWINDNLKKRQLAGETTISLSEYVVVDSIDRLRGVSDPHGVFVGTWRDRSDIELLVEFLITQTSHISPQLEKIRIEVFMRLCTDYTDLYKKNEK